MLKSDTFLNSNTRLARPVLGELSILAFLYNWNLFLEPLIFIEDINLYTLPLSPRNYKDVYGAPLWHLQLAATTLAVVPVLIVYVIGQRQVIDDFASSGRLTGDELFTQWKTGT